MNEITFRIFSLQKSIDSSFIHNLEAFIEQHGYHITEELPTHASFTPSIPKRISHEEFIRLSAEFSRRMGSQPHNSADLIREDRDNR